MSTDLPISPTDAFPSDIQQNKRFTIEEGMLKDVVSSEIVQKQVVKARIQLLALFLCMYLLGWTDGGLGALLPRIQQYYHVSYVVVSLIFVMSTTGFISAALVNVQLTDKLGFGKVLVVGLFCFIIPYTLQIPAFPFPVFLLSFLLNGFGFCLLCLADIGEAPGEWGTKDENKFSQILHIRAVYSMSLFMLLYVGIEETIGGWTVTFIMNVRHGGPSSGYVSSGFFGGIMLGRVVLVWLNEKIGGRRAIFLYASVALGLQLLTWFVPSVVGDAIAVSLIGLLLGPMYPLAMAHSGKIIPEWLVTASISFMAGIGQSGSAILPFVTGAIAGKWGIESLQPFLVIMMTVKIFLWSLVPSEMKHPK